MRIGFTAVVAAAAMTAGCGLTGPAPAERPEAAGTITVGDKSQQTQSVKCTQDQWALSIDASTGPGRARAYLEIGDPQPVVRTVNLENIDGLNAIAGSDAGSAKASVDGGNTYKITGTAVVSDPSKPGATTEKPFSIEVPC
jgi:ipoprotein LpqH